MANAKIHRNSGKTFVTRPQTCPGKHGTGKHVYIHPADTAAGQVVAIQENDGLSVRGGGCRWHGIKRSKNSRALMQVAASQLANYEWVTQHEAGFEDIHEPWLSPPEMIDPDRRIHEDHGDVRRLDGA